MEPLRSTCVILTLVGHLYDVAGAAGANGPEDDHADAVNGTAAAGGDEDAVVVGDKSKSPDAIFITGKPDSCEAAKEALLVSSVSSEVWVLTSTDHFVGKYLSTSEESCL